MWYLIQRYGVVNQRLRDLDDGARLHRTRRPVARPEDDHGSSGGRDGDAAPGRVGLARRVRCQRCAGRRNRSGRSEFACPIVSNDAMWADLIDSDDAALIDRKGLRKFGLDSRSPAAELLVSSVKDGSRPDRSARRGRPLRCGAPLRSRRCRPSAEPHRAARIEPRQGSAPPADRARGPPGRAHRPAEPFGIRAPGRRDRPTTTAGSASAS